ncbi:uncharacterized protein J3D65DRAFT_616271 [Phyllosticta citribraziliensis]|uniref:Secreted protein n=1 Tax=Phyllosticta citribraziliensis TaxID=989973 RepID=A0ABR1LZS2_9PEZI
MFALVRPSPPLHGLPITWPLVLPVSACPLGTESISLRNLACVPIIVGSRRCSWPDNPRLVLRLPPCAFPCVAFGLTCACLLARSLD